jgi:hypothetical protein
MRKELAIALVTGWIVMRLAIYIEKTLELTALSSLICTRKVLSSAPPTLPIQVPVHLLHRPAQRFAMHNDLVRKHKLISMTREQLFQDLCRFARFTH